MDDTHDPHDQVWYHRLWAPEWRWVLPIIALVLVITAVGTWREFVFARNAVQMRDWVSQQQYEIIIQQQQILANQARIMAHDEQIQTNQTYFRDEHDETQALLRQILDRLGERP